LVINQKLRQTQTQFKSPFETWKKLLLENGFSV
jgi:hypothetical protein